MWASHIAATAFTKWLYRWLRKWRKLEAELGPDGWTRTLRYTRAYRVLYWCMACVIGFFFSLCLVALIAGAPNLNPRDTAILGVFYPSILLWAAYYVVKAHLQKVRFDDEGFTVGPFLFGPVRMAWADVRSVSVSHDEEHLVIRKECGSAKVPVQMHGLGWFGLYLEYYAPVVLAADVRALLPPLEDAAETTPASSTP
jgi:hypothetical protein